MTFTLDRRTFIGGSAAAAGGLAVGIRLPSARPASAQTVGAAPGEITAWVVIKPDDTVVIRIARSEMGQGSLTGLAQPWPRSSMRLVARHDRISDARRQPRAQPRVGQFRHRRQHRHSPVAGLCPPRRRHGTHDAGAGGGRRVEGGCHGVHGRQQRHHPPTDRQGDDLRQGRHGGGQAAPADRGNAEEPRQLEDRGKPLKRLDTAPKLTGAQRYGIDLKLSGMLNAAIRECPVAGGRLKSFDSAVIRGQARRAQGRPGGRQRGGGHRGHLVARQEGFSRRCPSSGMRVRTRRS